MNQVEPLWPDVELYAIGDSHVSFFRGHDGGAGLEHHLPGAYTLQTAPQINSRPGRQDELLDAWGEVHGSIEQALRHGFQGWILLSYGWLDIRAQLYKTGLETGNLVQAVYDTVERYVHFIDAVRRIYAKVAIWAPVATQAYDAAFAAAAPAVGSEAERNFLTLLFTRTLRAHLTSRDVPLISITELVLLPDGRTNRDLYLPDRVHVSQVLMPHAVRLLNAALGTTLPAVASPTHFAPYPLRDFARVQETEIQGRLWLGFEFESALYAFAVYLLGNAARPIGRIEICASYDGQSFEMFEGELNHVPPPGNTAFIPVERLSRFLFIRADQHRFAAQDVRIDVIATRFIPGFPGNGHNTELFTSISEALITAQPPHSIAPAAALAPADADVVTTPISLSATDVVPDDAYTQPMPEPVDTQPTVSEMIAAALARMATVAAELPQPQPPQPLPASSPAAAAAVPRSVTQMFAPTPARAAAPQRDAQPISALQPRPTIEPRAAIPTVKDEIRLGRSIRSFAVDD